MPAPLPLQLTPEMVVNYHHDLILANGAAKALGIIVAEVTKDNRLLGNFPAIIERLQQMEGLTRYQPTKANSEVSTATLKGVLSIHLIKDTAFVPKDAGPLFSYNERVAHIFSRIPQILEFLTEREDNLIGALELAKIEGDNDAPWEELLKEAKRRKERWRSLVLMRNLYPNRAQAYFAYEILLNHFHDLELFLVVKKMGQALHHSQGKWIGRIHEDFILVLKRLEQALFRPAKKFRSAQGLDLPRPSSLKLSHSEHLRKIDIIMAQILQRYPLKIPVSHLKQPAVYELKESVLKEELEEEEALPPLEKVTLEKTDKPRKLRPKDIRKNKEIEPREQPPSLPLNEKQRVELFSAFHHQQDQDFLRLLFDIENNNLKLTHQEIKDFAQRVANVLGEMGISLELRKEFLENVKNHPSHAVHKSGTKNLSSHRIAIARMPFISIGAFLPRSWHWILKRSTDFEAMDDYLVAKARKLSEHLSNL